MTNLKTIPKENLRIPKRIRKENVGTYITMYVQEVKDFRINANEIIAIVEKFTSDKDGLPVHRVDLRDSKVIYVNDAGLDTLTKA